MYPHLPLCFRIYHGSCRSIFYSAMSLAFTTALVEDFEDLLESADDYDISIQAGKEINSKVFRAHANILKARSNYFKKALSHNYHEGKHETPLVIVIENITPAAFEAILK